MLNQATMDMLTSMKMTAMAAEFANQLKDPTFNELGFKERLGLLVSAEWNRRQSNKLNRFIRNARFNGIPFVPQKLRNFPAILEHRKIQTNPL